MTDQNPLAPAIRHAKVIILAAVHNLDALRKLEDQDLPVATAWREQAIRQAKDAQAVAQEFGLDTNERKV